MQENFILRDSVICDYSDRLLGMEELSKKLFRRAIYTRKSTEQVDLGTAVRIPGKPHFLPRQLHAGQSRTSFCE